MLDDFRTRRRRLLQGVGVGGTVALAGCTEQFDFGDDGIEDGEGGEYEAGIGATVDEQELQAVQMEVQQELEEGELDEEKAQQEIRERQDEIIADAVRELQEDLAAETDIAFEAVHEEFGAIEANGAASDLLGALELESVQGLFPVDAFDADLEE